MKKQKSVKKIALGGMIGALSLVLMMLTGIFPMADFALPAMAGVLLIPLVVEVGRKWAFLVYVGVCILSLILAPLKDSALFYVVFFGFYPILKSLLEGEKRTVREWIYKLLSFNLSAGLGALGAVYLFRLTDYLDLFNQTPLILAGGVLFLNVIFVIYDIALSRLIGGYLNWFRPTYLRNFK